MTLIVSFIMAHIGTMIAAGIAVITSLFALSKHQDAKAAQAAVAAKQTELNAATANAQASAAGEQAVLNRQDANKTAWTSSDADVDAQLRAMGQMRDDKK